MNDQTRIIRWGIIAPGKIAHKFAEDLAKVPSAKLTAVASRDLDRATTFGEQYGATYFYGSYAEIVNCSELDVVYVASPHIGHYEQTLLCINAGIPVLCEKAFGMNARQVNEMVLTARTKKVFLMEALWSRFMPHIHKLLELLPTIGHVHLLKADFGFQAEIDLSKRLFNKQLGGGALLDIGIYPLFLSYLVLGNPSRIQATAQLTQTGVDETDAMILDYENGSRAVLDCTLRAVTRCEASIYGQNGTIHIPTRWHEGKSITVNYNDGRSETFDFERDTHGYDYEIESVGNCLINGQIENKTWSLTDSQHLINLLDDVRQAAGIIYEEWD
jgi:predicted dehydrogenase